MKRLLITLLLLFSVPLAAYGHSCNDVFREIRDNLAVKVDIQDGQLRIAESARFRVYVLNTINSDIGAVRLGVVTDAFDAIVTPSEEWEDYPCLKTINKTPNWTCAGGHMSGESRTKGTKEHFEVELRRKSDTQTGKHKIGLRLYTWDPNHPDAGGDLVTIGNINDALSVMAVPRLGNQLDIDGNASASEWKEALLCSSMHLHVWNPIEEAKMNMKSHVQTRLRFVHEEDKLFALLDFLTPSERDVARLYFARDHDSPPVVVTADLQEQEAQVSGKVNSRLKVGVKGSKMEIELPLDLIGLGGSEAFYVNLARDYHDGYQAQTTYWRGNNRSVLEPLIYERFVLQ